MNVSLNKDEGFTANGGKKVMNENNSIIYEPMDASETAKDKEPSKNQLYDESTISKVSDKPFLPIKKIIYKRRKYIGRGFRSRRQFFYNDFWDEKNDENMKNQETIPIRLESLTFVVTPETVVYIEDAQNIYSTVYGVKNLKYRGISFRSVDEGYQYYKLIEFCNHSLTEQFKMKNNTYQQRMFVKRWLAKCGKGRRDVVQWRHDKGMRILFQLTYEKFIQNLELLDKLKEDRNKLLLNIFGEDNYDGCGKIDDLQKWLRQMNNQMIRIPCMVEKIDIKLLPKISTGKNIQGFILMMVRKLLEDNNWK